MGEVGEPSIMQRPAATTRCAHSPLGALASSRLAKGTAG